MFKHVLSVEGFGVTWGLHLEDGPHQNQNLETYSPILDDSTFSTQSLFFGCTQRQLATLAQNKIHTLQV